jgi:hypothetical protein
MTYVLRTSRYLSRLKHDVKRSNAVPLINMAMSTNKLLDFELHKIQTSLIAKLTIRKVTVSGAIYNIGTLVIMLNDYSATYEIHVDLLQGNLQIPRGVRYWQRLVGCATRLRERTQRAACSIYKHISVFRFNMCKLTRGCCTLFNNTYIRYCGAGEEWRSVRRIV